MLSNKKVVDAWLDGEPAHNKNMSTDGTFLYSYQLVIGDRSDNLNRVYDYTATGNFISKTTSRHVNLALRLSGSPILMFA